MHFYTVTRSRYAVNGPKRYKLEAKEAICFINCLSEETGISTRGKFRFQLTSVNNLFNFSKQEYM